MKKQIRVVETRVYEYTPDLSEDYYQEHGILDIVQAAKIDEADYIANKIQLDELGTDLPRVTAVWSVVDDPGT
jgi:hypothetical protein